MVLGKLQVPRLRSELLSAIDHALKQVLAPQLKNLCELARDDQFVFYHGETLPLSLIAQELQVQHEAAFTALPELAYSLESHGFRVLSIKTIEGIIRSRSRGISVRAREAKRDNFLTVLAAYGGQCAISRCDVVEVLDVCSISRRRAAPRTGLQNSILLRADLCRAFREDLIMICPDTRTVGVSVWACSSFPYWNEVARIPNAVMRGPFLRQNFEDCHRRARRSG